MLPPEDIVDGRRAGDGPTVAVIEFCLEETGLAAFDYA
jgi:hypothetical protein